MNLSGFVDLQVNGYAGTNFSSADLTVGQVEKVAQLLYQRGTLGFCPTVITSSQETYRWVLPLLAEAIRKQHQSAWECQSALFGVHLEGPFISPEDGAVGVHPRQYTRFPSIELFDELFALAEGQVALLTLAPELPGALDLIHHACSMGVVVSIGHTLADAQTIQNAVNAGARLSTHLGNGCPNLIHRHHNPIWPQLAAPELTAMLITDGHHLPGEVVAVMLAAKGVDHIVITSDVAPAAGCPPGEYHLFGTRVLLEASGRLRSLERDNLAGSSAMMVDCMNYLAGLDLLSETELWRVGRDNPLTVLGKTAANLPQGMVHFTSGSFRLQDKGEPCK
jgi:N-acetylglucosamine-6-phosphate deacetylase